MPTAMKEEEAKPSAAKPSIEVKQLQRYYTVLRDFMAHFHSKSEIYPPNHEFTQDELSAVTPQDIIKWMNVKLYNKEDPLEDDRPLNGSHHTLDYYKKSISYFMPKKEITWDGKSGNPTRAHEVNNLIKKIKDWDDVTGGVKKRKSLTTSSNPKSPTPPDAAVATSKKARVARVQAPSAQPLPPGHPASDRTAMQGILQMMHAQNASFIDLFGAMSQSLEQFKTTLQTNNATIMTEIARLHTPISLPTNATVATSDAAARSPTPTGVVIGGPGVVTGMLDWQYVHADGVRRRVPPTWQFPHCNLQEMYIIWHCGDYQNRISPMKLFDNSDVSFLGKRARMNLNEVKNLMATIDEEATVKGKPPGPTMTLNEAAQCFQAGLSGFNFQATTPTGKQRNILRLKWSTLTKYNKPSAATPTEEEKQDAEAMDEEKARKEFVLPSMNGLPHDNWFYEHDDGVRRRVPSTYKFPMLGLEAMYVLWHCGDADEKISPMKLFQTADLEHVKRYKTNLSEVRAVMTLIDLEATKRGLPVKTIMTPQEAKACCSVGHLGLNIPTMSSEGRSRDVLRMKWSSAVRLKNPTGKTKSHKTQESEVPEAELPEADVDV
ncbi:hypothetical protein ACHAXR_012557 [Thalassiosira sp. AJA248-18]